MEQDTFFIILRKRTSIFLLTVIILTLGTYIFTAKQKPTYQAIATVVVSRQSAVEQQKVSYYLYDNYYTIGASGLLTDTILSWLVSPSTVVEIYQKAQVPMPHKNASKLSKIFTTKKQVSTSNVAEFSLINSNKDHATKISQTALALMKEKVPQFGQENNAPFQISTYGPEILTLSPQVLLNTVVAFIASILLGLFFVFLAESFSKK